jgi:hypothetical protein
MHAEPKEISNMKSSAVLLMLVFSTLLPMNALSASDSVGKCSPQAIKKERVKLYLAAARDPLATIASQVYLFAADSERCRLNVGARVCGLKDAPLNSTDLGPIFDYYVKQPIQALLKQQQIKTQKRDWTWQPYLKQH